MLSVSMGRPRTGEGSGLVRTDRTIAVPNLLSKGRTRWASNWMEWRELAESIPPAYSEFIGRQIANVLRATA